MTGLLQKDLYMTGKYCRSFLLIMVVFLLVAVVGKSPAFLYYPVAFAGMIPMTLQSYDEREKWNIQSLTLPVSRRTLVSEKYIFGLVAVCAALLCCGVAQTLGVLLLHRQVIMTLPMLLCSGLMVGLVASGIIMPFVFKLGAEKGRIVYLVLIAIVCGGSVFLTDAFGGEAPVGTLANFGTVSICLAMLAISLVIYGISWLLSVKFYQNREM